MFVASSVTDGPLDQSRLCRIVNVASGTLLDVAISNDTNLPVIIGSPEEVVAVNYWKVHQLGPGWVLEAVRSNPDGQPRYLAPSGVEMQQRGTLTISKYPTTWNLQRVSEQNFESDEYSRPKDMEEEWICVIKWPYGLGQNGRVLDLENHGSKDPGAKVRFEPYFDPESSVQRRGAVNTNGLEKCQHWRIQFVPSTNAGSSSQPTSTPPPYGGSRMTVEANTKVLTTIETTTVTHTEIIPPAGPSTTKSYTSKTSTTSTAYFKPDGSVENEVLPAIERV